MTGNYGIPQYQGYLNKKCATIAEALKPAGYRAYMAGKWHVTPKISANDPKDNWPRQRGFDKFFGTIHGAGSLFDPNSLTRGNTQITPENDPEYDPEGTWYYTDAISDKHRQTPEISLQKPRRQTFLPLRRLHLRSLAYARPSSRHR